jgi:hypothetical protein
VYSITVPKLQHCAVSVRRVIEVSPNNPRSAKSTASETLAAECLPRRHVVRRVILQACRHSVTLSRQRELIVISARHPTVLLRR